MRSLLHFLSIENILLTLATLFAGFTFFILFKLWLLQGPDAPNQKKIFFLPPQKANSPRIIELQKLEDKRCVAIKGSKNFWCVVPPSYKKERILNQTIFSLYLSPSGYSHLSLVGYQISCEKPSQSWTIGSSPQADLVFSASLLPMKALQISCAFPQNQKKLSPPGFPHRFVTITSQQDASNKTVYRYSLKLKKDGSPELHQFTLSRKENMLQIRIDKKGQEFWPLWRNTDSSPLSSILLCPAKLLHKCFPKKIPHYELFARLNWLQLRNILPPLSKEFSFSVSLNHAIKERLFFGPAHKLKYKLWYPTIQKKLRLQKQIEKTKLLRTKTIFQKVFLGHQKTMLQFAYQERFLYLKRRISHLKPACKILARPAYAHPTILTFDANNPQIKKFLFLKFRKHLKSKDERATLLLSPHLPSANESKGTPVHRVAVAPSFFFHLNERVLAMEELLYSTNLPEVAHLLIQKHTIQNPVPFHWYILTFSPPKHSNPSQQAFSCLLSSPESPDSPKKLTKEHLLLPNQFTITCGRRTLQFWMKPALLADRVCSPDHRNVHYPFKENLWHWLSRSAGGVAQARTFESKQKTSLPPKNMVRLTIATNLQILLHQRLYEKMTALDKNPLRRYRCPWRRHAGAIVLLASSGEILASSSAPTGYSSNKDRTLIDTSCLDQSRRYWKKTPREQEGIFRNKVTQLERSPGSVAKLITLTAYLEFLRSKPNYLKTKPFFRCKGGLRFGRDIRKCHEYNGHSRRLQPPKIDLQQAYISLQQAWAGSCNTYFMKMMLLLSGATSSDFLFLRNKKTYDLFRSTSAKNISDENYQKFVKKYGVKFYKSKKEFREDRRRNRFLFGWPLLLKFPQMVIDGHLHEQLAQLAIGQGNITMSPLWLAFFYNLVHTSQYIPPKIFFNEAPPTPRIKKPAWHIKEKSWLLFTLESTLLTDEENGGITGTAADAFQHLRPRLSQCNLAFWGKTGTAQNGGPGCIGRRQFLDGYKRERCIADSFFVGVLWAKKEKPSLPPCTAIRTFLSKHKNGLVFSGWIENGGRRMTRRSRERLIFDHSKSEAKYLTAEALSDLLDYFNIP